MNAYQFKVALPPPLSRTNGFSLIEVLVALLVLSVGLLGLAGLQAQGIRFNQIAYLRSQASIQAYDMADRMRANLLGVANDQYDNVPATKPPALTSNIKSCIAHLSSVSPVKSCTPAEIATYDIFQWNTDNATILPSGIGSVVSDGAVAPTPETFTITVTWVEQTRNGPTNQNFAIQIQP